MKKIIVCVLITIVGLTSCAPAVPVQPGVTYAPSNTTVAPPAITPAINPLIITPSDANTTFTVTETKPQMIITSNTTMTTTVPTQISTKPTVANAMVQVWRADSPNQSKKLVSYGLAVGDGSQILTFFDYENFSPPGLIEVVAQNYFRYSANIQAIDPFTGTTLLKLNSTDRLPAVNVTIPLRPDPEVLVWGWQGSGVGFANATMSNFSDPLFNVSYNFIVGGEIRPTPYIDAPGAVITDLAGNVLGIETTVRSLMGLTVPGRSPGLIAPAANIGRGIELLSPEAANRGLADGLAVAAVQNKTGQTYHSRNIIDLPTYEKITLAIRGISGTLDSNITAAGLNPLPTYISSTDGTVLALVFVTPIELKSSNGTILAQAKWVAIQWGRDNGQPNRLIYGSIPYMIEGGFVMQGNITSLQHAIYPP